jgi:ribosomal protein L32
MSTKGDHNMADIAYCVKCKEKREMKDPHHITMKNGKPALQGLCPVCGTRLNRILPAEKKV